MQSSPFQFGQQPQATVTPQPQQGGGTVFGGGFGTGGGLFSQQSNPAAGSQPSFANFGVATSTTTAPQSGGGTPSFGTFGSGNTISFGTPTAAGANPFGFGKPQQASTPFGGGVAPTPAFGFGLGSSTSTSTPAAPLGGGGGLFGAATPQATSIFGATQPQQQQPPATNVSFGFGTGQQQAAPQGSLFGGFGQAQAPQQQQQKPLFNLSGLGGGGGATGAGVGPTFGASGSGFNFGQFQQNQQHQQQPSQQQLLLQQMMMNEQAYIHHSIFDCQKFGDIRDSTLSMLNFLLSCWGIGEGHFAPHHPPIPYSNQNILYLFKAVGYSYFYTDSNEDGQVILHLKRPLIAPASPEENEFLSSLQTIVGGPNIIFRISGRKALPQESCQIILIADDRSTLRRILATELAQVLAQPQIKPQLDRLGVVGISPKVKPSPQQLKAYFENPPGGMDPRIWMKAIEDNPDPQNMIPVPIVGAEALKQRLEAQEKESLQHEERLKMIGNETSI
ncbi:unnamed protein product [Orchesella dallaii]|uniref:Nucleoporin Nup54 alpha-helical domain-containing protein n=1 Tax=Orchesella dallaii TaxID=48710 RepID=A0ABP1PL78_9HEXA